MAADAAPPPPPTELTLFIPFNAPRFARRFPVEFNMYLRDCFNNVDDKTPSMLDETELKRAEMLVLRDQRKKQKKEVRAKGLSKKAQRLLEKQAMVEKKRKAVEATTKTVVKLTPPPSGKAAQVVARKERKSLNLEKKQKIETEAEAEAETNGSSSSSSSSSCPSSSDSESESSGSDSDD